MFSPFTSFSPFGRRVVASGGASGFPTRTALEIEFLSETDYVSGVWSDTSGNSRSATLATVEEPANIAGALNGLSVKRFYGAGALALGDLSSVFPAAATLFAVFKPSNDRYVVYGTQSGDGTGGSNNDCWWGYSGSCYQATFRAARIEGYPATAAPDEAWSIVTIRSSSSAYEVRVNGASQGVQSAGFLGGHNHFIGGSPSDQYGQNRFLIGDVAEIGTYSVYASDAEVGIAEAYLASKFAL